VVYSDGLLDRQDFTLATARLVRESGPWGQAFPEPTFDGRFRVVESRVLGNRHLKLKVCVDGAGPVCEAIAFRYFDHDEAVQVGPETHVDLAFRLDVNEYAGTERLQLLVEHLEIAGEK